jgi:CRISPR-associated endonuclease Cas2
MRAIVCYDFSDDKARTRFAKLCSKYGFRIQYSIFEFHLDRVTWQKLVAEMQKKKFLDGNHNIVIIPITDGVHKKIIKLGNFFMAFDYSTLLMSAFGVEGLSVESPKSKKL